jgi:hypothetical protein
MSRSRSSSPHQSCDNTYCAWLFSSDTGTPLRQCAGSGRKPRSALPIGGQSRSGTASGRWLDPRPTSPGRPSQTRRTRRRLRRVNHSRTRETRAATGALARGTTSHRPRRDRPDHCAQSSVGRSCVARSGRAPTRGSLASCRSASRKCSYPDRPTPRTPSVVRGNQIPSYDVIRASRSVWNARPECHSIRGPTGTLDQHQPAPHRITSECP